MRWRAPATAALFLAAALPATGGAADPDSYDPLLDGGPARTDRVDRDRVERHDPRSPGFTLTGLFGLYAGRVRSFLLEEESGLGRGAHFDVGIGIGYRTRSPIELGLDFGLGFGQTYEKAVDHNVPAYDGLIEPRLYYHYLERETWSAYGGATGTAILFDLGAEGINQAGIGPGLLLGVQRRLDRHSLLFLEATGVAFHDFLAYHYEYPTEEELLEDPEARRHRVVGEWFGILRIGAGYRLTSF